MLSLKKITAVEAKIGVEKIWQYFEQNSDNNTSQCVVVLNMAVSKVTEKKFKQKLRNI